MPDAADLLEAAPVALLHVGADGDLLRSNAAARALCADADAAPALQRLGHEAAAQLRRGEPPPRRLPLQTRPERWLEVGAQALAGGGGGWMLSLQPAHAPGTGSAAEAESALALAVDLGGIAVWRHDLATRRVHYNAHAYQVLGIAPRPQGLSLREVRELIHPEDLRRVMLSAREAMSTPGPVDIEARYRRADGGWRQVMTRRALQRAEDGTPLAFIGVALDISARHQQRLHAEAMARRFELATAAAGVGYWVLERGQTRASWSEPLRAMFGLAANETVPTFAEWLASTVHPDERVAVRERFAAWARSRQDRLALPIRSLRPDGSLRYLATHSRLERDGERPLMFGVVIDLTELRSTEHALRNAETRVALAARGAGLGTWELDLDTEQAYWDAQMWHLRGHAPRPEAMDFDERLACVHPDDRALVANHVELATATGQPCEYEFRVVWPNGELRWLASRSVQIRDAETGTRRRIGMNWDITDKRNADVARREREAALHESQAKSKFLARMSHELRTPLNAVLGFSQLLLAEGAGHDAGAASRQRRIEYIRSAGQHLLELINDVLDLSSLEGGELQIALQPLALAPLVEQTLPMLATLRDSRDVSLDLGPLPGCVMADPTRLRQVLLNLLSNAIKYNRIGGRVRIEARALGDEVVLSVTDTGRGMNAEQLRHLFEPFNRLGRQDEGEDGVEGSGIGLAIVKALVRRMGGSVQVQSTPGVGSVFELRLAAGHCRPVVAGAADAYGPLAAPAPAPAAPRATLLYVEDNPVNALIISELVARRSDLKLHVAVDGETGVRRAMELRPDLVLLDMQLPDIDGHEVLRRLRAHPSLSQVPVIALSANAMPEEIDRALRAGMSDYWTKPLNFNAFMASLEALFGPMTR